MKKGILIFLILSLLTILIYFLNINFNNSSDNDNYVSTLSTNTYKDLWIDLLKYNTFDDFLNDFKTFSWVYINPVEENFVIWVDSWSGQVTYIPFSLETRSIFDNKDFKNQAIIDIYNAYKAWEIYGWKDSSYNHKIIFKRDVEHNETPTLRQIFWKNINVDYIVEDLEKVSNIWSSKNELLAYLYDFTGRYDEANLLKESICTKNEIYCKKNIEVTFSWSILDESWNSIAWAKIELLNNPSINTISDQNWNYNLSLNAYSFSHLRLKASKKWFSDSFYTISLNTYEDTSWPTDYTNNFVLNSATKVIDLTKENLEEYSKWWFHVFKTEQSTYFVPKKWLYYLNWENYTSDYLSIYMYEFNKWTNTDWLLLNDTFDPVYWYVWNLMKTFGMPYIQFFDKDWNELFVKSSNPIILQNQIYHMKELYENYDQIYEAITDEDMKYLVEVSDNLWWYPIDLDWQIENNFLKWPAWWALDRKTWIWSNVWHKVLTEQGLVELPFYSIKDN